MTAARARRGLGIYFGIVVVGTAVWQILLYRTGDPIDRHVGLVLALMWTPAFASVVARLVQREGFADVSFRFGGRAGARAAAIAWVYPLLVGAIAYGVAWTTGLEHFHVTARDGTAVASPALHFAKRLALALTIYIPLSAITAAGEELGWRGYMLTRLVDAKVPRPVLVSALVWGLWHTPLILSGQYASGPYPLVSALLFVIAIVPESYLNAYVRLASGSVWPAVIAHSAWNSVIQSAFDPSTAGGSSMHTTSIWIGESGVLVVLVSFAVTALLLPKTWTMRRSPCDAEEPLGPALRL